jgi:hypothetical protein
MNSLTPKSLHIEIISQLITLLLSLTKQQNLIIFNCNIIHQLQTLLILSLFHRKYKKLINISINSLLLLPNLNMNRTLHKTISQPFNFLWPSSTKHTQLSTCTNLTKNLSNLRLKTHIQHPISLI